MNITDSEPCMCGDPECGLCFPFRSEQEYDDSNDYEQYLEAIDGRQDSP